MGTPRHMSENISINPDKTMTTKIPRLQNTSRGLRWRMVDSWNDTPVEIREIVSLPRFKLRLKSWIISKRGQMDQDTDTDDENDDSIQELQHGHSDQPPGRILLTQRTDQDGNTLVIYPLDG